MIYRVYVEKKHEVDNESRALLGEINGILGISSVTGVRVLNRYDVEHIEKALFESCVTTVFSEPQTDDVYFEQPAHEGVVFAVEPTVRAIPFPGLMWLLAGGIAYTVGAVLYGLGGKRRWMHSVFHIFVVLGSGLQFLSILGYAL